MDQNKVLSIDVTVSEKENVAMQASDGDNVTVSPQDVVKVTTDNYEDLQNLPTIDGEPLKGEVSGQIETLIPNVPDWAMQQQPPKYTYEDVGAVSEHDFSVAVENLNEGILEANSGIQSNSRIIAELTRADSVLDEKKVDKVVGKGLSTNDLTNELLEKINKDEQNVQADWDETNSASDAFIKNKPESMPASDVHEWAKAAQKPSYTAEEIGALPENTTTITPEQAQQIEDNAEQIVKVKKDIAALDKRVDNIAITQTFSGQSILAEGTLNSPFKGLKLFGRSTQDGTPSPDNPIPVVSAGDNGQIETGVYGGNLLTIPDMPETVISNITVSVKDGVVSLSGQNTNGPVSLWGSYNNKNTLFVLYKGTYSSNVTLRDFSGENRVNYNGTFFVDEEAKITDVAIATGNGNAGNFYPMLNLGVSIFSWEPYKQSQTLSYSTPNGLPGIPVSSGGNYTDENGQQWICDEVDFGRGVYVKRVKRFLVDENNMIVSTNQYNVSVLGAVQPFRVNDFSGNIVKMSPMFCDKLINLRTWGSLLECCFATESTIDFNISNERLGTTEETTKNEAVIKLKNWLVENPLSFLCVLSNVEEVFLTSTELSAYAALHTNYPTTTVMNDAGTGMECKCEMETKSYIEKNFVSKSELKGMVEQILSQNTSETVYSDEEYGV